ncbi:aminoacyl tRNA synthase complex-interacting multifunctional protein 1-like [Dysidea avara]|uniref:aminoacyl tRNA synthase complex-interacting multifunctional protein 1-like n=1 Tax=Dysidea avara TaxID=196820 RepID=UPI0033260AD8
MADERIDEERLAKLKKRADEAEKMVVKLRQCVEVLKRKAAEHSNIPAKDEATQLERENIQLRKEVDELRKVLIDFEARNGIVQVPLPTKTVLIDVAKPPEVQEQPVAPVKVAQATGDAKPAQKPKEKQKEKSKEKKEKPKAEKSAGGAAQQPVDVSRCDFRIGKIVHCEKHPDADTLYVEKIDVGEDEPRTVLSGLVNDYSLDEMQNRMVVVICNLKPRSMRGIMSHAMVMCAFTTSPETSQFIDPPPGSVIGDRVTFDGYEGKPDEVLNPKKKIFEQVQPDLHTDANCIANYKGVAFTVPGKGVCKAASFANCGIK